MTFQKTLESNLGKEAFRKKGTKQWGKMRQWIYAQNVKEMKTIAKKERKKFTWHEAIWMLKQFF